MNKNRKFRKGMLYAGASLNGFRRKDENAGGGQTGENQNSGNQQNQQDNNGQKFDPSTFWQPKPEEKPTPQNQQQQNSQQPNQQQEKPLGAQLQERIQTANFGEFLNDNTLKAMEAGDYKGFNEAINKGLQGAIQNSMEMSMQVMEKVGEQMIAKMQGMIDSKFDSRDNNDFLTSNIEAAKDPAMYPYVKSTYEQALKMANGNRGEALDTTKRMMTYMAQQTGKSFGFDVVESGSQNSTAGDPGEGINWKDLLGNG